MILILDLGNDALNRCLYDGIVKNRYRTYTDKRKSEGEYVILRKQYLSMRNVNEKDIEGSILSSVVPSRTNRIKNAARKLTKKECRSVGRNVKLGISIRMDNPSEVGSDLLSACVGALSKRKDNYFIADLSSVSSFIVCTEKKEFIGGALFPGRRNSSAARRQNSAQLRDIELESPKRLIGKSTKESRNSGILFGYQRLCKERLKRRKEETKRNLYPILTGNNASILKGLLEDFEYDPDLIFKGLADIYIRNTKR